MSNAELARLSPSSPDLCTIFFFLSGGEESHTRFARTPRNGSQREDFVCRKQFAVAVKVRKVEMSEVAIEYFISQ